MRKLVGRAKARHPEKSLWIWTGNTYEELQTFIRFHGCVGVHSWNLAQARMTGILSWADVLVDGPFIEAEKDLALRFRGSRNQRIIDLQRTKEKGEVILWDEG